MTEKLRVGFIGIGTLGKPMSQRLLAAGFRLLFSISGGAGGATRARGLQGASPGGSPGFGCVITPSIVEGKRRHLLGEGGLLKGANGE